MSEKRKWLRFCYKTPKQMFTTVEYREGKAFPTGGWAYALVAIRSDGYAYESHCYHDSNLPECPELEELKKTLRLHLETMLDEDPPTCKPHPEPWRWLKGVHPNWDEEWVEATDGTVEELK